jgi:hypothetical protein
VGSQKDDMGRGGGGQTKDDIENCFGNERIFFNLQLDMPTKGDWVSTCFNDSEGAQNLMLINC